MAKNKQLINIMAGLAQLTDQERGEIVKTCTTLGTSESSSRSKSIHDEDEKLLLFYDILVEIMKEVAGQKLPKAPSHLSPKLYRSLKSNWTTVDDFLNEIKPRTRLPQRTKFYRIVILITIDYITNLDNIPVSPKTVIEQLRNCPSLLHQQFPGYLQAGLLPLILSWGDSSNTPDDEDF